jgi:hypothetical protein
MRFRNLVTLVWLMACGTSEAPASRTTATSTATASAVATPPRDAEARELVAVFRRDYSSVWSCIVAKGEWVIAADGNDHATIVTKANEASVVCETSAARLVPVSAKGACAKLAEQSWRAFLGGRAKFQRAWSTWFSTAGLEQAMRTKPLSDVLDDEAIFKTMPKEFNFEGADGNSPDELTQCIRDLVLCNGRECEGEYGLALALGLRPEESSGRPVVAKATSEGL